MPLYPLLENKNSLEIFHTHKKKMKIWLHSSQYELSLTTDIILNPKADFVKASRNHSFA